MKKGISTIFLICAFLSINAAVETNPIGSYKIVCPPDSDTIVSVPFTRAPVFSGELASVSGKTVVLKDSPAWENNSLVYAAGVQPNHYYLIFTSGAYEGVRFEIDSNTASSVTLIAADDALDASLVGTSVQIIPHWTLNALFPEGASIFVSTTGIPKNSLFIKTANEAGVNFKPGAQYFYFKKGGYSQWARLGDMIGDNLVNHNDTILQPEDFFFVRTGTTEGTLNITGQVRMFNSEIRAGTYLANQNQDNYIPNPSCFDITLGDLTESLVGSGIVKKSRIPADTLFVYNLEGIEKNRSLISYYYYFKAEGSLDNGWYAFGSEEKMDSVIIKAASPVIFRKTPMTTPEIKSASFTPNYLK